jgi:hypothetical protein
VSDILRQPDPEHRAKIVEKFVKIAAELISLHNYNASAAIMLRLCTPPIDK